jgi:hypothetical protein
MRRIKLSLNASEDKLLKKMTIILENVHYLQLIQTHFGNWMFLKYSV